MPRITDYLVQGNNADEFDRGILSRKATPVNMRLFRSSPFFRQLIMDVVNYMDSHLSMTYDDNAAPMGVSAVTLGIPWNIIGYKHKGRNKFCINPKITKYSTDNTETSTNCGALRLNQDIKVLRSNNIDFEYFDLRGQRVVEKHVGRYEGAFVIQHEVEHGLGVCITDKEIKQEKA